MCGMRCIHLETQTSRVVCYAGPSGASPVPCSKVQCEVKGPGGPWMDPAHD